MAEDNKKKKSDKKQNADAPSKKTKGAAGSSADTESIISGLEKKLADKAEEKAEAEPKPPETETIMKEIERKLSTEDEKAEAEPKPPETETIMAEIERKLTADEDDNSDKPKAEKAESPDKPKQPKGSWTTKSAADAVKAEKNDKPEAKKAESPHKPKQPKGSWTTKSAAETGAGAKRAAHAKKRNPMKLIIFLVGFIIVGIGVYALVHFVIAPGIAPVEPAAPTEPAQPAPPPRPTAALAATGDQAETSLSEYEQKADLLIEKMSLDEKICQLFIVTPEVLTDLDTVTEANDTLKSGLESFPVGGVIFSQKNFSSDDQAKALVSGTASYSMSIPLFIAVDDDSMISDAQSSAGTPQGPGNGPGGGPEGGPEGGPGSGPGNGPDGGPGGGPGGPTGETIGSDATPEEAYDNALTVSQKKGEVGFNLDMSLAADISADDGDQEITPETVGKMLSSAIKGYIDGGMFTAVKYFPALPDDGSDATGLPRIDSSADELSDNELVPFRSGIEAGADMIIVGHVFVEKLDSDKPATLSGKVVPELLREKLGYTGVVVSDNMSDSSITEEYSYDEIVKGLFDADIDLILNPDSMKEYSASIEKAIEKGEITEEQLNAKVRRVIALKYQRGLIK